VPGNPYLCQVAASIYCTQVVICPSRWYSCLVLDLSWTPSLLARIAHLEAECLRFQAVSLLLNVRSEREWNGHLQRLSECERNLRDLKRELEVDVQPEHLTADADREARARLEALLQDLAPSPTSGVGLKQRMAHFAASVRLWALGDCAPMIGESLRGLNGNHTDDLDKLRQVHDQVTARLRTVALITVSVEFYIALSIPVLAYVLGNRLNPLLGLALATAPTLLILVCGGALWRSTESMRRALESLEHLITITGTRVYAEAEKVVADFADESEAFARRRQDRFRRFSVDTQQTIKDRVSGALGNILRDLETMSGYAPCALWSSDAWSSWKSEDAESSFIAPFELKAGTKRLALNTLGPSSISVPQLYDSRGDTGLLVSYKDSSREPAVILESAVLRTLATTPVGQCRFVVIDPLGLGQNAAFLLGLQDYDEGLIGPKVWSEPHHIEARLQELSEHMATVIQKYLRNDFWSVKDYNEAVGDLIEPYRYLLIYDFPNGFTEGAIAKLRSVVQSGPRCGVITYMSVEHTRVQKGSAAAELLTFMEALEERQTADEPSDILADPPHHDGLFDLWVSSKSMFVEGMAFVDAWQSVTGCTASEAQSAWAKVQFADDLPFPLLEHVSHRVATSAKERLEEIGFGVEVRSWAPAARQSTYGYVDSSVLGEAEVIR